MLLLEAAQLGEEEADEEAVAEEFPDHREEPFG